MVACAGTWRSAAGLKARRTPSADSGDGLDALRMSSITCRMTWVQRLKRVFGIGVETCIHCSGQVKIVASVEEPQAIRAILYHFEKHGVLEQAHYRPQPRGPPVAAA